MVRVRVQMSDPWRPKKHFPESSYPNVHILGGKKGRLLDIAFAAWKNIHGDMGKRVIKDSVGAIAYRVEHDFVLTAKRRTHGYYVSFSKSVVDLAFRDSLIIVLYLRDLDLFYDFKPMEIYNHESMYRNILNGQTMLNCSVQLGTRHKCTYCEEA